MKQLKLIQGIAALAIIILLALFVLDYNETEEAEVSYTYPTSGEYTSYEVEHIVRGYEGAQYESTAYGMSDEEKQALFEEYNEMKTFEAEYEEARDIASGDDDQTFAESEEDRIEQYCSDYGFESCYNIQYTCETEWGCHLVTITCDNYDYDPSKEISWGKKYGCDEWIVEVEEEDFDIRYVDESYYDAYGWQG
jgi:hypothetical protein